MEQNPYNIFKIRIEKIKDQSIITRKEEKKKDGASSNNFSHFFQSDDDPYIPRDLEPGLLIVHLSLGLGICE